VEALVNVDGMSLQSSDRKSRDVLYCAAINVSNVPTVKHFIGLGACLGGTFQD